MYIFCAQIGTGWSTAYLMSRFSAVLICSLSVGIWRFLGQTIFCGLELKKPTSTGVKCSAAQLQWGVRKRLWMWKRLSVTLRRSCLDLHRNTRTLFCTDTHSTFSPPSTNKQIHTVLPKKIHPSLHAMASGASCTVLIQYVWRNVNNLLRNAAFPSSGFPVKLEDPDTGACWGRPG